VGQGVVFRDRYFASGFGERSPVPKGLKVEQMKKKAVSIEFLTSRSVDGI
jgi:hypothetical protein